MRVRVRVSSILHEVCSNLITHSFIIAQVYGSWSGRHTTPDFSTPSGNTRGRKHTTGTATVSTLGWVLLTLGRCSILVANRTFSCTCSTGFTLGLLMSPAP